MAKKSYWQAMSLHSERDRSAVLSWFDPLADGMTPYKADILCDIETDATKKLRVLMRDDDGRPFKFERTFRGKRYIVTRKPIPTPTTPETNSNE